MSPPAHREGSHREQACNAAILLELSTMGEDDPGCGFIGADSFPKVRSITALRGRTSMRTSNLQRVLARLTAIAVTVGASAECVAEVALLAK